MMTDCPPARKGGSDAFDRGKSVGFLVFRSSDWVLQWMFVSACLWASMVRTGEKHTNQFESTSDETNTF
jgi:hypothetical protein